MAVKQLRRLGAPSTDSFYDRLASETLHYAWSRDESDAIPREHPELIVEREGNVLAAFGEGGSRLVYAFRSPAAFVDHFPPMLELLLPRVRKELRADDVLFRLDHNTARPAVEPVLRRAFFSPSRFWLRFTLDRARVPKVEPPKGVKFRDGSLADADAIIRLDREAFPNTPMPAPIIRANIEQGEQVLLATVKDEIAGMALYLPTDDAGGGYLHTLAVTEGYRGRSIGAALTARVAKRAFAAGAAHLDLRTNEDNGDAIRLYMRLGFRQSSAGRDYTRLTDPRSIAKIQAASKGALIRFGGWR